MSLNIVTELSLAFHKYVVGVNSSLPYVKAKPLPRLELVLIVKSINLPSSYHS
nr:MAG TPA: hypothetical protein [Caudoviricetes sp.]